MGVCVFWIIAITTTLVIAVDMVLRGLIARNTSFGEQVPLGTLLNPYRPKLQDCTLALVRVLTGESPGAVFCDTTSASKYTFNPVTLFCQ